MGGDSASKSEQSSLPLREEGRRRGGERPETEEGRGRLTPEPIRMQSRPSDAAPTDGRGSRMGGKEKGGGSRWGRHRPPGWVPGWAAEETSGDRRGGGGGRVRCGLGWGRGSTIAPPPPIQPTPVCTGPADEWAEPDLRERAPGATLGWGGGKRPEKPPLRDPHFAPPAARAAQTAEGGAGARGSAN